MNNLLSRFNYDYFFGIPATSRVLYAELFFYLILLVIALYLLFIYKPEFDSYKKFAKNIAWVNLTYGVIGLFLVFARYEYMPTFYWRFWQYLLISLIFITIVWLFKFGKKKTDMGVTKELDRRRKDKWLKKKKK